MNLIIVESPTKEKTISRFFKKDFIVKSTYGHVRDLPDNSLGINIENNFTPEYIILPRAKKIISEIENIIKKTSNIYLATDFDREGEAIAWHLVSVLGLDGNKVKRITFHEITPNALYEAIKNPRNVDMNLVNAQQTRRILDRLVGYKLSPLLWKKVARGLSAGRVQSVAVRLICDREEEIKNFIPVEYWNIKAKLEKKEEPSSSFEAILVQKDGKKIDKLSIKSKKESDEILKYVEGKEFKVVKIIKKEKSRNPNGPFTTATLQAEAAKLLHFSPTKTMSIAQQLYEGIKLPEEGSIGLITYMRTDSMHIAVTAVNEVREYIEEKFGKEFIPDKARIYKTKQKNAQEAHECIRPTSVLREPDRIKIHLTPDQYKLYKLIWKKFVSSQMSSAIYDTVTVDISCGNLIFRANGRTLKFQGFLIISGDIDSENKEESENILPKLEEKDILKLLKISGEQHFTEPPPRYNHASLIKELEKNGIGRPSTYAPIIETIIKRKYVNINDGKFYPTNLGITVNEILKNYFHEIVDVNFTAKMEEDLDRIADGNILWTDILKNFYKPFENKLMIAQQNLEKKKIFDVTDEKCPVCGAVMYIKEGRFGKFLSCSKWPECKSTIPLDRHGNKKINEKINEHCPECGKDLLKRSGRRGFFIACSGFPQCKYTRKIENENKTEK